VNTAAAEPPASVTWSALFAGSRGRLLIGLMVAEIATALQILVVVAILPLITRDLGGTSWYGLAAGITTLATLATIPLAGGYADRYGIPKVLGAAFGLLIAGVIISGTARSMPVLVLGRLAQGLGAGAQVVVSLTGVTRIFPAEYRPRVLMLTSVSWVLPSLIGPAYGTFLATWFSWRVPILLYIVYIAIAGALVIPALSRLSVPAGPAGGVSIRESALLAVGSVLVFGGLEHPSAPAYAIVAAGLIAVGFALSRLLPSGTARLRPGLPATAVAALIVAVAFYTTQTMLPVLMTARFGVSLRVAGFAITAGSLLWTAGTALQTHLAERGWHPSRSARIGVGLLCAGQLGVLLGGVTGEPVLVYALWPVGGIGMGLCYSAIWLNTMNLSRGSRNAIASTLLMFTLGTGFGAGIAGTAVSIGGSHRHLFAALAGVIVVEAVISAVFILLAGRLAEARATAPTGDGAPASSAPGGGAAG
jgi:MFS family permease